MDSEEKKEEEEEEEEGKKLFFLLFSEKEEELVGDGGQHKGNLIKNFLSKETTLSGESKAGKADWPYFPPLHTPKIRKRELLKRAQWGLLFSLSF